MLANIETFLSKRFAEARLNEIRIFGETHSQMTSLPWSFLRLFSEPSHFRSVTVMDFHSCFSVNANLRFEVSQSIVREQIDTVKTNPRMTRRIRENYRGSPSLSLLLQASLIRRVPCGRIRGNSFTRNSETSAWRISVPARKIWTRESWWVPNLEINKPVICWFYSGYCKTLKMHV